MAQVVIDLADCQNDAREQTSVPLIWALQVENPPLDPKKIVAWQDGQARLMLDSGPFAVIVLGGAHDLSDNVERLSGGKAEYIRVEVEEWKKFADEVE